MDAIESGETLIGREYFIKILGEGSQDFVDLEEMVEDTDGKISWEDLQKFAKIENGEVEGIYWESVLNLEGTRIRNLGKLKKIGGHFDCCGIESFETLGELEEVGGSINLMGTKVKSLGKLKKVGGDLDCNRLDCLESVGDLEEVGGYLDLSGTSVKSLGKLKKIGRCLDCYGLKNLEDLGMLSEVFCDLDLRGIKIDLQLEAYEKVNKGELIVKKELRYGGEILGIEKLLELEELRGNLDLMGTKVKSLGKLKKVGGDLDCYGLESIEDLGDLVEVGGSLNLIGMSITLQIEVMKRIMEGKFILGGKIYYDNIIKFLNLEKIIKCEVNIFGKIEEMLWVSLFSGNMGEYDDDKDGKLRELRYIVGQEMMGKYDKSIKEYLEKCNDKLDQEMVNSIEKDLKEKKELFRRLFGERLVGEMFGN